MPAPTWVPSPTSACDHVNAATRRPSSTLKGRLRSASLLIHSPIGRVRSVEKPHPHVAEQVVDGTSWYVVLNDRHGVAQQVALVQTATSNVCNRSVGRADAGARCGRAAGRWWGQRCTRCTEDVPGREERLGSGLAHQSGGSAVEAGDEAGLLCGGGEGVVADRLAAARRRRARAWYAVQLGHRVGQPSPGRRWAEDCLRVGDHGEWPAVAAGVEGGGQIERVPCRRVRTRPRADRRQARGGPGRYPTPWRRSADSGLGTSRTRPRWRWRSACVSAVLVGRG